MKSNRRTFLSQASALWAVLASPILSLAQTTVREPQIPFRPRPKEWQADWYQLLWEAEKIQKGIVTDTLVIHHTAGPAGATWQSLSELEYHRLYGGPEDKDRKNPRPRFWINDSDPFVYGLPATSGHYRLVDGKMVEVFYAYHWLIRPDGSTERLLQDHEVGWQAGDWGWNMRSLGLCFDGDHSVSEPTPKALNACAKLIKFYAGRLPLQHLKGHSEVRKDPTTCPGPWFFTKRDGLTGRERLLKMSGIKLAL